MGLVIVLLGPPLPGRDLLERALEGALPAEVEIVADRLATVAEREEMSRRLALSVSRPLFVVWECDADEAEREIFRHYVSTPRRQAERRWQEYLDDVACREPPGREAWPRVVVRGGEPLDAAVARVLAALDAMPVSTAPRRRVLVVDDDLVQRDLLADAFEALGCVVFRASNATEARQHALASRFELMVTDHDMPDQTGAELAAAVRQHQPDLNVAVVTGHPDKALDALLARGAFDLVLTKPVGIADLVHVLDELARRRAVPA